MGEMRQRDTGFFVVPDQNVSLAWSWALEALADSEEVDISLLRALVSRVPNIESDLFISAKERIASRLSASEPGDDALLHFSKEISKKTTDTPILGPLFKAEPYEQSDQQSLPNGGSSETLVPGEAQIESENIRLLEWHASTTAPLYNGNNSHSACKTRAHKRARGDACFSEKSHFKDDTVPGTSTNSLEALQNGKICSIPHLGGPSASDSSTKVSEDGRFCTKCSQGGDLLFCETRECPISVHESCLGASVSFDDQGNFYCPYCVYKQAKEKVSLAHKALLRFVGSDLANTQGKMWLKRKLRHHSQEGDCGGFGKHDGDEQKRRVDLNECRALVIYHDPRPACESRDNGRDDKFWCSNHLQNRDAVNSRNHNRTDSVDGIEQTAIEVCPSNKFKNSNSSVHSRKPLEGRKKIPWTKEEEETLKEGVRKYPDVGYGIQWTKILEYGRLVYHSTRTTLDLKNRWRCIQLRVRSDQSR